MAVLSHQAAALDSQFRNISTERQQYRVDSEVGASMGEMQAKQVVLLRWVGVSGAVRWVTGQVRVYA